MAHAGNDHRLGAHEAPPAIISLYPGTTFEAKVQDIIAGGPITGYVPRPVPPPSTPVRPARPARGSCAYNQHPPPQHLYFSTNAATSHCRRSHHWRSLPLRTRSVVTLRYTAKSTLLDAGCGNLNGIERGLEDRNRTAPFPFCGNRFEFRAVGSSQNCAFPIAMVNTVFADGMRALNELLEAGTPLRDAVAQVRPCPWP